MERESMNGVSGFRSIAQAIAILSLILVAVSNPGLAQTVSPLSLQTAPAHAAGQSATLLPDGRWILVGGTASGAVTGAISIAGSSGAQPLALQLQFPRTGHSATVLPDGRVFVFGG